MREIAYQDLSSSDLYLDAIYKGKEKEKHYYASEVLSKLLKVNNSGGFRYPGTLKNFQLGFLVLKTSFGHLDWPDSLDMETGEFTYFGDNRTPGNEILDTKKKGNEILQNMFEKLHAGKRNEIPPIFIFSSGPVGNDMIYRGIAVPGTDSLRENEDLVAVWKSKDGSRFQNYRAHFTVLDVEKVSRTWIESLRNNSCSLESAPESWKLWVKKGVRKPLISTKTLDYRKKEEQLPVKKEDLKFLRYIYECYKKTKDSPMNPIKFEKFAIELARLMDRNIVKLEQTRATADGGRDGIGKYRIGLESNAILVDFALEAKCYEPNTSVGVKELSRLISRLRHRQFGIIVTTSFVAQQAYQEIIEDQHPIVVISGIDIIQILKRSGFNSLGKLKRFLISIEEK